MTDHFMLRMIQLKMLGFQFVFLSAFITLSGIISNNCNNVVFPDYVVFVILCFGALKMRTQMLPWNYAN